MRRERDTYRQRVYDAEWRAFRSTSLGGTLFTTVPECQAYVDKLVKSAWGRRRDLPQQIIIKPGQGRRSAVAYPSTNTIALPKWARSEWVICHEVAHLYARRKHGRYIAWHGREFAQCYIELVGHKLGAEAATRLKAEFSAGRVPWRKKKAQKELASTSLSELLSF